MTFSLGLIHDWLDSFGGAERQIEQIIDLYPDLELYTVFDLREGCSKTQLVDTVIHTSGLNRLPGVKRYYRNLLLLAARAVEKFDLSRHDIVFSVSSAVSKGVITQAGQPHIAYVNSPARYAWGMQHEYLANIGGPLSGLKRAVAAELLHRFRIWDVRTANGVDLFCGNSRYIQERIWKVYRRRSYLLYPPVDTSAFMPGTGGRESFYVTASRMVPYKRIPLIVEAFSQMPDKRLIVIGDGPEMKLVKRVAAPNIEILGYQPFEVMLDYFQRARAFVFAAQEDFGIVPVEAQACGTPVIALSHGGTAETIKPLGGADTPTGVWFDTQTVEEITRGVAVFEQAIDRFDPDAIRRNALFFGNDRFKREVAALVEAGLGRGFREDHVLDAGLPVFDPDAPPSPRLTGA